jgi:hypothetical protein
MPFAWNPTLLDQIEFPWNNGFLPRLATLTDEA